MTNLIERLTPEQSKDVLTTIVSAGLIKESQIRRAVIDRANSHQKLVGLLGGDTASVAAAAPTITKVAATTVPQKAATTGKTLTRADGGKASSVTPNQLASRQLQGRYLGLIRHIPAKYVAKFKALAKEKGREVACKAMERYEKDGTVPGVVAKVTAAKPAAKVPAKKVVAKKAVAAKPAPKPVVKKKARPVVEEPEELELEDIIEDVEEEL